MNEKMALNLITRMMGWDDATATTEFDWLRLIAAVKYDGYADFRSGIRFLESLVTWLKQFESADRAAAYDFVKNRLVYVSPAEMLQLVEAFFPEVVGPHLRAAVASGLGVEEYEVWATSEGRGAYEIAKRKTLFVGMSDGSRIDLLRRANAKTLSTEQIIPMMNVDTAKWEDLAKNLETDLKRLEESSGLDAGLRMFDRIYLIDDFTASGTTFIRRQANEEGLMVWKGKLQKFNNLVNAARLSTTLPLANDYDLHIHHYISSDQAHNAMGLLIDEAKIGLPDRSFGHITFAESLRLPPTLKLTAETDGPIISICDKYYDHGLFKKLEKHCAEAKMEHIRYGYADCALPVVLEHNTPNNSLSILWANTDGEAGAHMMESLFQRRDRHG